VVRVRQVGRGSQWGGSGTVSLHGNGAYKLSAKRGRIRGIRAKKNPGGGDVGGVGGEKVEESREIGIQKRYPPIEEMDIDP